MRFRLGDFLAAEALGAVLHPEQRETLLGAPPVAALNGHVVAISHGAGEYTFGGIHVAARKCATLGIGGNGSSNGGGRGYSATLAGDSAGGDRYQAG